MSLDTLGKAGTEIDPKFHTSVTNKAVYNPVVSTQVGGTGLCMALEGQERP